MVRAAVIGKDGRTTALRRTLQASPRISGAVPCLSESRGAATEAIIEDVVRNGEAHRSDFVFLGPPVAAGVVDALEKRGIPCIGPTRALARLESSKAFTRDLVACHALPGHPEYRVFTDLEGMVKYLRQLGEIAVKPDGLTSSKGVTVSGTHLLSIDEALTYTRGVLQAHPARGVSLLEHNARLGDPEALNVLPLLRTDLVDICEAIVQGVEFARLATVCKYVVSDGYPDAPVRGARIGLARVPRESDRLEYPSAAVDERADGLYLTGSRAIGFVGIGPSLSEAEAIAEEAARAVAGPVFHRRDIGTPELIARRRTHMRRLRAS